MTDLILMLIEFDGQGGSVGRSWEVEDPETAARLRHIASNLGEPMTDASNTELERRYERRDNTT